MKGRGWEGFLTPSLYGVGAMLLFGGASVLIWGGAGSRKLDLPIIKVCAGVDLATGNSARC